MKRTLWIVFPALVLLAGLALFRPGRTGETLASMETLEPPPPAVTVRHEFITVSAPAATASPARTARRPAPPAQPAAVSAARPPIELTDRPAVRTAARGQSLFERARRAVVGDGRYRPQPFPRVKGDNN